MRLWIKLKTPPDKQKHFEKTLLSVENPPWHALRFCRTYQFKMNLAVPHKQNPLLCPSTIIVQTSQRPVLLQFPPRSKSRISQQTSIFRIYSSANPNGSDGLSWPSLTRAFRLGSERFLLKLRESVKRETGFHLEGVNVKMGEFAELVKDQAKKGEAELNRFRAELLPEFLKWNRWERWKVILFSFNPFSDIVGKQNGKKISSLYFSFHVFAQ